MFKRTTFKNPKFSCQIEKYGNAAIITLITAKRSLPQVEQAALSRKIKAVFSLFSTKGIFVFNYPKYPEKKGFIHVEFEFLDNRTVFEIREFMKKIDFEEKICQLLEELDYL